MALRIDSWKYPLETLDGRKPEVLALGEWLQLHKPRISRPSATALSDRLMTGRPVGPNDLLRILGTATAVQWRITADLLRILNDVNDAYAPERARRAAYLKELNDLRGQIPNRQRNRMREIADRHHWLDGPDRDIARLGVNGCRTWLAMSDVDRDSWFTRVEAFLADLKAKHRRDTDEIFKRTRKRFEAEYGPNWMKGEFRSAVSPDDLQTLGLPPTATQGQIKTAFRQMAKQHHPDVGGDPAKFMAVQKAYESLKGAA